MENMVNHTFWQDRPTFVTGGTGLVGSWLIRRLVEAGADVVCLVRDWVPQSELVRKGYIEKVKVVRGDVRDRDMLERALGEFEIDTVIHLAAQTIVTIANRNTIAVRPVVPPAKRMRPERGEGLGFAWKGGCLSHLL